MKAPQQPLRGAPPPPVGPQADAVGAQHGEPSLIGHPFDDLIARATVDPGEPFVPAVVTTLAWLPRGGYETLRARLKAVGVRVAELDRAIKDERTAQADARRTRDAAAHEAAAPVGLPDSHVDLGVLLAEIMTWIRRYVVLTDEQAIAVVLWVVHTHAIAAADCTPYLQITSATKRAGKTRLLEVLEPLVARPWFTGRTTAAALVRRIDQDHSTLLLDESDAAFSGEKEYAEALRGILNGGYRRSGKYTCCVKHGGEITTQDFSTFSPKAIAGIGKLPDTVADRSIPIALRRRTASEPCERWRERSGHEQAAPLRTRLATWARGAVADLRAARPDLPLAIGDRLADVWEPLIAIAESAGGDGAEGARRAAVALAGIVEDTDCVVQVLADIADILDAYDAPFIPTAVLIGKLVARDERPWATWRHDKAITPKALAALLGPLSIHSKPGPDGQSRGYRVDAFDDARGRYLPSQVSMRQTGNEYGPETPLLTRQREETIDTSKTAETSTKTAPFDGLTHGAPDQRLGAAVRGQTLLFPPPPVQQGPLEPVAMAPVEALTRARAGVADDPTAAQEEADERAAMQAEACEGDNTGEEER